MKTSYIPKAKSIEDKPSTPIIKPESVSLVDTYKEVVGIKNIKEEVELSKFQEAIQENSREEVLRAQYAQELAQKENQGSVEQPKVKQQKKKKKSKKKLIIILSILAVLIVGGCLGGFYLYSNSGASTEDVSERINKFYTSDSKVDIKDSVSQSDLDSMYIELQGIKKKSKEVSELTKELDTIGYFIQDKATLNKYDSDDCSLTTSNLTTDVTAVKSNTSLYSISGLAVTNSDRATSILTAYDDFINLRLELQGITDVQSFDENAYTDKINNVTHTVNKQELQGIVETIKADKEAADAQAAVDAAGNEEEKAAAQKALEDAQELQKQTQQQLEEVQKKLENATKTDSTTVEPQAVEESTDETN